jgi:glycerol-3-phosphate acyltransferase PlsY
MTYVAFALVGYLLGSVPFGLIVGRVSRGTDVREYGSGKTGMTNVMRTHGRRAGVLVLLLDMGKSAAAIGLAKAFSDPAGVHVAAGLAAIFGHNWPVFVGFRGGRGTSPGWGGLIVLSPVAGAVAGVTGALGVALTRYMSVASIAGAALGSATLISLSVAGSEPAAYAWYGAVGTLLILALLRDNIQRLINGEERKLGQPAKDRAASRKTDRRKGFRWQRSA